MPTIIVMGMHRSGTSLVSHLLHIGGVNMGKEFLSSDTGNPNGYWEDKYFLDLNRGIVSCAGGSWENPPSKERLLKARPKFAASIAKGVEERKHHAIWGWKDPRNSLTAFLYHEEIENPRYVVVSRKQASVVASLEKLWGGAHTKWTHLCQIYNRRIETFIVDCGAPVKYINYDMLMDARVAHAELSLLNDFCGVNMNRMEKQAKIIRY